MRNHTWKRITGTIATIAMATPLSGCHTVHSGAPHPFTTMFRKDAGVNHFAAPTEPAWTTAEPVAKNDLPNGS
ncbi:MAG: hypothetical protein P8J37_15235 [Fuerstiella sp.]|nr:hypothetical protein [Fuerstiella sp.]